MNIMIFVIKNLVPFNHRSTRMSTNKDKLTNNVEVINYFQDMQKEILCIFNTLLGRRGFPMSQLGS